MSAVAGSLGEDGTNVTNPNQSSLLESLHVYRSNYGFGWTGKTLAPECEHVWSSRVRLYRGSRADSGAKMDCYWSLSQAKVGTRRKHDGTDGAEGLLVSERPLLCAQHHRRMDTLWLRCSVYVVSLRLMKVVKIAASRASFSFLLSCPVRAISSKNKARAEPQPQGGLQTVPKKPTPPTTV